MRHGKPQLTGDDCSLWSSLTHERRLLAATPVFDAKSPTGLSSPPFKVRAEINAAI